MPKAAGDFLATGRFWNWNGERIKMVYAFHSNEALWQRYAKIRDEGRRNGNREKRPTSLIAKPKSDERQVERSVARAI